MTVIGKDRIRVLKHHARCFASDLVAECEPQASGQFDCLETTNEEMAVIEAEMRAISERIYNRLKHPAQEPLVRLSDAEARIAALTSELAEARDKALEEAFQAVDYMDPYCYAHEAAAVLKALRDEAND